MAHPLGATTLNPPFAAQRVSDTIRRKGIDYAVSNIKPRTVTALPDESEAQQAHKSLLERIGTYGLRERKVEGDGNCQFRAVADQLYGDQSHHLQVRQTAVLQLEKDAGHYSGFVQGDFDAYLVHMSEPGTW